jgi:hypothetical protein
LTAVTDSPLSAFICAGCGSVYSAKEVAEPCESTPAEPETLARGTLVRPVAAGEGTGLGWVTGSFLLGLDDPRGEAHVRFYRASFLWGRADFRAADLESLGTVSEAEWREAVARGDQ